MKKFLFIFLSSLLFQQIIAQTIVKFGNGKNLKYKDLQGKTVIKNKEYIIAFTDSISSIGFVGTKKGKIICVDNAGKELFEVYKVDNGPDYVCDGMFRIVGKDSKIGFADTCGVVIIPPVFRMLLLSAMEKPKLLLKVNTYNKGNTNLGKVIIGSL